MTDQSVSQAEANAAPKRSVMPAVIGVILAVVLGGGGFYASYSGVLDRFLGSKGSEQASIQEEYAQDFAEVVYVPIDPILISLPSEDEPRHLRFRAHIETIPAHEQAVADIMPRIMDVLNGYLRAVANEDLERPTALIRLRAQMLRRIRLVADQREIRDLLVTEFVLN